MRGRVLYALADLVIQVGVKSSFCQLLEEPLSPFICLPPIIMTPCCNLHIDSLGHVLCLGCVWDDGVNLSRGALAELEEEGGLVRQLDLVQHVAEQDPSNLHASSRVANNLRRIQILYPVDRNQCRAQVVV